MDFFQFLQNSKNENVKENTKQTTEKTKKTTENTKQTTPKNRKRTSLSKLNDILENKPAKTNTKENVLNSGDVTLYKNVRKGDFVKIIYIKDSPLNSYKGYIGEIRDYKKDQDTALVFLHAISSQTIVKFPVDHFYKLDY